ncbi:MAG: hypothetical protein WCK32_02025 [Chlorobiaceae bacterium]
MDLNEIQDNLLKSKTLKIAVPTILLAPVAIPVLQGLAGIAIAGLGLLAGGTLIGKAAQAFSPNEHPPENQDEEENI